MYGYLCRVQYEYIQVPSRDTAVSGVILDADLHQSIITCRKARGVTAAFETALNNLIELRPKIEINERTGSKPLSGGFIRTG